MIQNLNKFMDPVLEELCPLVKLLCLCESNNIQLSVVYFAFVISLKYQFEVHQPL